MPPEELAFPHTQIVLYIPSNYCVFNYFTKIGRKTGTLALHEIAITHEKCALRFNHIQIQVCGH
jgi:hypothetical protein